MRRSQFVVLGLLAFWRASATPVLSRVYVAQLDESTFTLAWGKADGKFENTIGYAAKGSGQTSLQVGSKVYTTNASWYQMTGLAPDTEYKFVVKTAGQTVGSGSVRTWPKQSRSLTFFVIGDWGNGSRTQYAIAARMEQERVSLEKAGTPVRFVLSTGDNIYKGGAKDRDWELKFFAPYQETLRSIPFYAVLGNHDGNESEASGDLPIYLDNFFGPSGRMTRWYRFQYGGFVEFFALDSTTNQYPNPKSPAYLKDGQQSDWLNQELKATPLPWRIAAMHHPMFTAGPNHKPSLLQLSHWFEAFSQRGVSAIFAGHEHNLQISERNAATGQMQFVVSGAGGELRSTSVRKRMNVRNIAGWAPQAHFLVVQIEGDAMTIMPLSNTPLILQNASGQSLPLPIRVPRHLP